MYYYLNNFYVFSIFGFIFETFMFKLLGLHNQSGFMFLGWTPFYGVGIIIINLIYRYISKFNLTKLKKVFILAIIYFFALSLLELTGGFLLELLFGYSLWTYEVVPFHIGKYISVPTSLIWVFMTFVYLKFIKKYSDKLVTKLPHALTIILSLLFITDFIITVYRVIIHRL